MSLFNEQSQPISDDHLLSLPPSFKILDMKRDPNIQFQYSCTTQTFNNVFHRLRIIHYIGTDL